MINKVDLKKMEGENQIHIDKFVEGKVFREMLTAHYLYTNHKKLDLDSILEYVPSIKEWKGRLDELMNKVTARNTYIELVIGTPIFEETIKYAKANNLLLNEYIDIAAALEIVYEDLELLINMADSADTFKKQQDIAKYLKAKGYRPHNYLLVEPTEKELDWINAHIQYTDNGGKKDIYGRVMGKYKDNIEQLYKEVYEARNNKYSLYTPYTWHTNFVPYGTNKSAKISMLSLTMSQ